MPTLEVFGKAGAKAGPTKKSLSRYSVVEECVVRKTIDTKSAKVGTLMMGESVEVIEIGPTNAKGRTRLRIADPPGWVSDQNKEGHENLTVLGQSRTWSAGSIDMSAFESGGAGRDSFKANALGGGTEDLQRLPSQEEDTKGEQAAASPAAASMAGAFSEFGQQRAPGSLDGSPTAGAVSAFGQPLAVPAAVAAAAGASVFGQQQPAAAAPAEGVPGKSQALAVMLPVIAGMPDAAFGYMSDWMAAQGSDFAGSVAGARAARAAQPAAFGGANF